MGFLERVELLRQQQAREEQIKLEAQKRIQNEAALASEKAREEYRSHASEDNKAICKLIDNLPALDMETYMKVVAEQTGYRGFPFLYTRDISLRDPALAEKLPKIGLRVERRSLQEVDGSDGGPSYLYQRMSGTYPSDTFHGFEVYNSEDSKIVKPQTGNLFSRKRLTEPQEPGIGLYFSKIIGRTSSREVGEWRSGITIINHVFVRFVLPSQAIITGDGERIDVTSVETFDNALERGFKHPHQTRTSFSEYVPYHGNG